MKIKGSALSSWSNTSAAQFKDIFRQLDDGSLTYLHIQALIDHCNPFELDTISLDWSEVYRKLGLSKEYRRVGIDYRAGSGSYWRVLVLKEVNFLTLVEAFRLEGVSIHFNQYDPVARSEDMVNERYAKNCPCGWYTAMFFKTIGPNPHLYGESAQSLKKAETPCITLLEYLLLDFAYFLASGGKLLDDQDDTGGVTLCAGSSWNDGYVPTVRADSRKRTISVLTITPDEGKNFIAGREMMRIL